MFNDKHKNTQMCTNIKNMINVTTTLCTWAHVFEVQYDQNFIMQQTGSLFPFRLHLHNNLLIKVANNHTNYWSRANLR